MYIQIHEAQKAPIEDTPKKHYTETHNKIVELQGEKENFESSSER